MRHALTSADIYTDHGKCASARCAPFAATFAFLLNSLDAGLKSLDVSISSQCAAAVDNLAGYYFKHMPGSESPTPAAAVSLVPSLFWSWAVYVPLGLALLPPPICLKRHFV